MTTNSLLQGGTSRHVVLLEDMIRDATSAQSDTAATASQFDVATEAVVMSLDAFAKAQVNQQAVRHQYERQMEAMVKVLAKTPSAGCQRMIESETRERDLRAASAAEQAAHEQRCEARKALAQAFVDLLQIRDTVTQLRIRAAEMAAEHHPDIKALKVWKLQ